MNEEESETQAQFRRIDLFKKPTWMKIWAEAIYFADQDMLRGWLIITSPKIIEAVELPSDIGVTLDSILQVKPGKP